MEEMPSEKLASKGSEFVRRNCARLLVSFYNHRQQQGYNDSFHDHIGEHEGLHNGIDRKLSRCDICKDRCSTAHTISNAEEQDVGRTL